MKHENIKLTTKHLLKFYDCNIAYAGKIFASSKSYKNYCLKTWNKGIVKNFSVEQLYVDVTACSSCILQS